MGWSRLRDGPDPARLADLLVAISVKLTMMAWLRKQMDEQSISILFRESVSFTLHFTEVSCWCSQQVKEGKKNGLSVLYECVI